jgi:chromosome segregation ATPase
MPALQAMQGIISMRPVTAGEHGTSPSGADTVSIASGPSKTLADDDYYQVGQRIKWLQERKRDIEVAMNGKNADINYLQSYLTEYNRDMAYYQKLVSDEQYERSKQMVTYEQVNREVEKLKADYLWEQNAYVKQMIEGQLRTKEWEKNDITSKISVIDDKIATYTSKMGDIEYNARWKINEIEWKRNELQSMQNELYKVMEELRNLGVYV